MRSRVLAILLLAACAPGGDARPDDPGLSGLGLRSLAPDVLLPGSVLTVNGESFVSEDWGASQLHLAGDAIDVRLPLGYVDEATLEVVIGDDEFEALGGDGSELDVFANVEVLSAVDGRIYRTSGIDAALALRSELAPRVDDMATSGVIFPNEPIAVIGSGFLLLGEGETLAVVSGCFTVEDGTECAPVGPIEVPLVADDRFDRTHGTFAFAPEIAGITPGHFDGEVLIRNRHASGSEIDGPALQVAYDLERPIVYGASTDDASLGRYVTITGGGFIGGEGTTLLEFTGTFTTDDTAEVLDLDEALLPELVDGHAVRYVINENDALGQRIDVRYQSGLFQGTVTPRIEWRDQSVAGDPAAFAFHLAKVKQVVYVNFLPVYVESLRAFGLRAIDDRIRARVLAVLQQDFATIGVELREEAPDDWAYYAQVDVGGPDPNGLGLLGYDNTHGKDTGNVRLYDRIGGVNALTQQDGYPGYGGVFIESLFGYSEHPGKWSEPTDPDDRFDAIFDPFRPDRGGKPVGEADLAGGDVPMLGNGDECPSEDRTQQIACAVWVLGNMIGTTVSHELGHSFGLADPYGPDFHDLGDEPNRMMDADRPFAERAVLDGEGPSLFCDEEYAYLRQILPTDEPDDPQVRPPCN